MIFLLQLRGGEGVRSGIDIGMTRAVGLCVHSDVTIFNADRDTNSQKWHSVILSYAPASSRTSEIINSCIDI